MSEPRVFRCSSCGGMNRVDAHREGPTCGRCKASLDTSGAPVHLDDAALQRVLHQTAVPVLVDFYADWCGPCRALAPRLDQIARAQAGKLLVVKVDTDKHGQTAGQLGVKGIPALYLYKGGRQLDNVAGALSLPDLQRWVGQAL